MNNEKKTKNGFKRKLFKISFLIGLIIVFVAYGSYMWNSGFSTARSGCPDYTVGADGQWFAVNHSFVHVYEWEWTGNSTWRFYWDDVDFENMTGTHVVEFPDDGHMWVDVPFGLVKHPSEVIGVQEIEAHIGGS